MPNDHSNRIGFQIRLGDPADISAITGIDADASTLFVEAGLDVELPNEHEFSAAERDRWLVSLSSQQTFVAVDATDDCIGFAANGHLDGHAYLIQLSVRRSSMRSGIGTALLGACERLAGDHGSDLWLTTYSHLAWNQPFYESRGFEVVHPDLSGPEMAAELAYEQRWLPEPHRRVVMRKLLPAL